MRQAVIIENRNQVELDGEEVLSLMHRSGGHLSEAQICASLLMLDEADRSRPPEMRTHEAVEHLVAQGRIRVVYEPSSESGDPWDRVVEITAPTLPSIRSILRTLLGRGDEYN